MNEIDNIQSDVNSSLPQTDYKLIQDVYFRLTSKKETLSREIDIKHKLSIGNIKLLGEQLKQWSSAYNVISNSCSVTVYHENGMKEIFSSIERFMIYNTSNNSPIENITIEYNLLINVPGVDQPQSYKAYINAHSIEAIKRKTNIEGDFGDFVLHFMPESTGNIRIEYIDYIVARSLQSVCMDWFRSLEIVKTNHLIETAYNNRKYIQPFLRYSLFGLIISYVYTYLNVFEVDFFGARYFFSAITALILIRTASDAAYYVGQWASKESYRMNRSSIICINNGDAKLLDDISSSQKMKILKVFSTIAMGIAINIVSAFILRS